MIARRMPTYVDAPRLCEELSICERTADAWVRQGVIPAPLMRGGKRLWKWTEVERYLDDGGPNMPTSADAEAERVRNVTKRLAEKATENRRGHVRRRDKGISGKSELHDAGTGNAKELSRVAGDG